MSPKVNDHALSHTEFGDMLLRNQAILAMLLKIYDIVFKTESSSVRFGIQGKLLKRHYEKQYEYIRQIWFSL